MEGGKNILQKGIWVGHIKNTTKVPKRVNGGENGGSSRAYRVGRGRRKNHGANAKKKNSVAQKSLKWGGGR